MMWRPLALSFFLLFHGTGASATTIALSAGGYVPFGLSTQKDEEGERNTISFHPAVALNGRWNIWGRHFFSPEVGFVIHLREKDKHSKTTTFFLLDMAYPLGMVLLRYGLGFFRTSISGEGEVVQTRNGLSTIEFYAPSYVASVSNNMALDLGFEFPLGSRSPFFIKTEAYIFKILSSVERNLSYSLSFIYYL